uniref:CSON012271 protein n=1 Tax=Culicoides sonorensis TaxID=179676 RepID=A0A336KLV0_CULSO
MQPTVPQSGGIPPVVTSDMDLPAVQSMDWLINKDRFYVLAKLWEQVSTNNSN